MCTPTFTLLNSLAIILHFSYLMGTPVCSTANKLAPLKSIQLCKKLIHFLLNAKPTTNKYCKLEER